MNSTAQNLNLNTPWKIHKTSDLEALGGIFSNTCVFLDNKDFEEIINLLRVTQKVFSSDYYKTQITPIAPQKTWGLFCCYDFHLTTNGPKLIEINTNAGGALLNYDLASAQKSLPQNAKWLFPPAFSQEKIISQFEQEWKLSQRHGSLQHIAVVDDAPQSQFLFPEFLRFQKLLTEKLAPTVIVDPKDLVFENNELIYVDEHGHRIVIDLVYNRLTDFYYSDLKNQAILKAFDSNACVISPNPFHHALYAHKNNLIHLTDTHILRTSNLEQDEIALLISSIPNTKIVKKEDAATLWHNRKNLFFKPALGYGSKAVYRGDKITHKVFEDIIQGSYLAQEYVPAAHRMILNETGEKVLLKFDLRVYTYGGEAFLFAARLYEGQATNFRTLHGGFAPVYLAT